MAADHLIVADGEDKAATRRGRGRPRKERTPKQAPTREPLVYFIQAAPGWPIKIGFTTNMTKRLRALRGESGLRFEVLAVMEGSIKIESGLHRRFRDHRIVGEWFRPIVGLVNFIKQQGRPWREAPARRRLCRTSYLPSLAELDAFPKRDERRVGKAKLKYGEGVRLRDALIRRMIEDGHSVCEVAGAVGRSERTVYDRLEVMDIPAPRVRSC